MSAHWHQAHGLRFRSALALPEFAPAGPGGADIVITAGDEARRAWQAIAGPPPPEAVFTAAPGGGHVMRIGEAGEYWVREGREIHVTPVPDTDPATLRLFLLGSALGMAFHQRGLLVLHGATVRHGGGATVFVGESGEGKSTLAAHLGHAGHAILGDDTVPLWPRPEGGFEVWPGSRTFKLWSDTIEALGASAAGLECVGSRLDKYFFRNPAQPADAPVPLREIVVLETASGAAAPEIEPVAGLEALRIVAANTYRPEYVLLLGREAAHFRLCSALAGAVAVIRLRRPWAISRIGETIDLIRASWTGGAPLARRAR